MEGKRRIKEEKKKMVLTINMQSIEFNMLRPNY